MSHVMLKDDKSWKFPSKVT